MFSNFNLAGPISRGSSSSFEGCDTMGPAHIDLVVRRLLSMKAPKVTYFQIGVILHFLNMWKTFDAQNRCVWILVVPSATSL